MGSPSLAEYLLRDKTVKGGPSDSEDGRGPSIPGSSFVNPLALYGAAKNWLSTPPEPLAPERGYSLDRMTFLPFGVDQQGHGHLAMPGIVTDTWDSIQRSLISQLPRSPDEDGYDRPPVPPNALDGFNAASAAPIGAFGARVAGVVDAGDLGVFAGKSAKTADHAALAKAEQMAAQGVPREQIWSDTGWFQGADGNWKFEIDDSGAKMAWFRRKGNLSNVLKHPELYDAYPSMRKIPTTNGASDLSILSSGGYSPHGEGWFGKWRKPAKIAYSPFSELLGGPDASKSTLLHEAQHALQQKEGFARGAASQEYTYLQDGFKDAHPRYDHARAAVTQYADALMEQERPGLSVKPDWKKAQDEGADNATILKVMEKGLAWEKAREEFEKRAYAQLNELAYERSAGEVEARNVQARQHMNKDERRATPPWMTQDTPDERQIIQKFGQWSPLPNNALNDIPVSPEYLPPAPLAATTNGGRQSLIKPDAVDALFFSNPMAASAGLATNALAPDQSQQPVDVNDLLRRLGYF